MSKIHISEQSLEKLRVICEERNNDPGELINILHAAQEEFGYLPQEVQETPKGKYPISVCMGTACYVRGAERVLEEIQRQLEIKVGETTPDGLFSLDCLRCVGACGLAPVLMIGNKVYGRVSPEKVRDILSDYYMQEG